MPKVSVIIPIYNTARFLPRCLESLLSQTFTDFELLLINDGSIDGSLSICMSYAENDKRIRVIDQANAGVSVARNTGLRLSQGEWITFIDSDDEVAPNYFSVIETSPQTDLIIGSMVFDKTQSEVILAPVDSFIEGDELRNTLQKEYNNSLFNSPCAKFYRKSIIDHNIIRFDEGLCFGEDAVFVKNYLLNISNIQISNTTKYIYYDIGDEIYEKYSGSFLPIYSYYQHLSEKYLELEKRYCITLSKKELIGVVYNILILCVRKSHLKEWILIKSFLLDNDVRQVLRSRHSWHINVLLETVKFPYGYIFISYFKFVDIIRRSLLKK